MNKFKEPNHGGARTTAGPSP